MDKNLSYKPHVDITLKKAYVKIAALRRIKRSVPSNKMITLCKAYVLPHFEYCSPLLLGISRTLTNKLERANYRLCFKNYLKLEKMACSYLRHMSFHRLNESLLEQGRRPGSGIYNHLIITFFRHNSFSYIIADIWHSLPSAHSAQQFR